MLLGLTGGIGAGKSTALAAFARLGCPTLSSDAIVHALYLEPEVRAAVVERFGPGVLGDDGEVDRAGAGRARASPTRQTRRWLEQLLHPLVAAALERWRASRRPRARARCSCTRCRCCSRPTSPIATTPSS